MIDKRVLVAGFVGGVAIGLIAVNARYATDRAPTSAGSNSSQGIGPVPANVLAAESQTSSNQPTFAQFVSGVAAQQGGKISFDQLEALANIYANTYGGGTSYQQNGAREPMSPLLDPSVPGVSGAPYSPGPTGRAQSRLSADVSEIAALEDAYRQSLRGPDEGSIPPISGGAGLYGPAPNFGAISGSRVVEEEPPPNIGAIDVTTGQFMAPAGPGGYVDPRDGTFYAPSGPNGVVNTRDGEYSPISH